MVSIIVPVMGLVSMLIKHVDGEVVIRLSMRILVVPYFLQAVVVVVIEMSMLVNMPVRR